MLDNFKCFIRPSTVFENNVCKNPKVDLRTFVSTFTGEVTDYPKIGKYLNLDVRITGQQAYIKGSLHKFMNAYVDNGEHNYNDFDFRDIELVIENIVQEFDIDPKVTSITNLEFGMNVILNHDPQELIDRKLLMFNFRNHNKDLKFRGKGDYKQFDMSDYSIKIYNKSKQYRQDKFILRVEVKFTMKRILQKLGIHNLADLTDTGVLQNLFGFLMQQFDKLVIVDDFYERGNISVKEKARITMFTNPNYWMNMSNKPSRVRERLIREFKRLIRKHKLDVTKNSLRDALYNKFLELMRVPAISLNEKAVEM
ncbi:MAG: hypothetical protein EOO44_14550 [Flavobacterium sp.]|nr:MAG: hypothetical protein EOO44_14550 [Flavobacterium sp.]